MLEKVIIAGSGGQGIMLAGKVLAEIAMRQGKYVTWIPSYGAEVRGGAAHCMVVISDQEIGSPYIDKADSLIAMNSPALEKFKSRLAPKGLLIVNSSLANQQPSVSAGVRLASQPFSDIALELGNIKVANMAALGCFIAQRKIFRIKDALEVIRAIAPADKQSLVGINQQALSKGAQLS